VNLQTGAREWASELSSIDSALLVAGVLTVRQCFADDADVARLGEAIYRRIDFSWMLAGDPGLLSMGWKPESGFLTSRWDHYCELMILYLLGIGSPTHPIPAESWRAWRRPTVTFEGSSYVGGPPPLFVHQYAHAWVDFRGSREREPPRIDWFENSVVATRAHRAFNLSLAGEFPGYTTTVWGITASDSRKGYVAWGGPPREGPIDGSVVPSAATGSLMFAPDLTRLRRRLPSDRWLGESGRHRYRPRHHAAERRESSHRARLAVVHEEPGDASGDAPRGVDAHGGALIPRPWTCVLPSATAHDGAHLPDAFDRPRTGSRSRTGPAGPRCGNAA
jgi:hypothetical protein